MKLVIKNKNLDDMLRHIIICTAVCNIDEICRENRVGFKG